jgi:hypothetical protein
MIRFLIEHALPEKGTDVESGITQNERHFIHSETQKLTDQGRFTSFPFSDFSATTPSIGMH